MAKKMEDSKMGATVDNKRVSGFGLRLRPNPRYARTTDTRGTLG